MENNFIIANAYYDKKDYYNALKYYLKSNTSESIYNAGVSLLEIIRYKEPKDIDFMVNATKKLFTSGYLNKSISKYKSLFNLIFIINYNKKREKNFSKIAKAMIGMVFLLKTSYNQGVTLDEIETLYSYIAPYASEKRQMDKINYEDRDKYIQMAEDYIANIHKDTPINLKEFIYNKIFGEEQNYSVSVLQDAYESEKTLDSFKIKVISEKEISKSLKKKRDNIHKKYQDIMQEKYRNSKNIIVVEYHKEKEVFEIVEYDGPNDKIIETVICRNKTTKKYNTLKKKLLNIYNTKNFIEV